MIRTSPLDALRYHVSGAVERGESTPIVGIPACTHDGAHEFFAAIRDLGLHQSGWHGTVRCVYECREVACCAHQHKSRSAALACADALLRVQETA